MTIRVRRKDHNKRSATVYSLHLAEESSSEPDNLLSEEQASELVERFRSQVDDYMRELAGYVLSQRIPISPESRLASMAGNSQSFPELLEEISPDIELDDETDDRLTALSEQLRLSKAELIRAGVALLEIGIQAKQEGFKFGVVTKDQPLVSEVVGL